MTSYQATQELHNTRKSPEYPYTSQVDPSLPLDPALRRRGQNRPFWQEIEGKYLPAAAAAGRRIDPGELQSQAIRVA
ncbi:hypothetical protein N7486_004032 [Penicillium sp. IBT 16267x]|nr:hypothetical protein N7486_004032 [Penicillium sp. IBT 16267x]